MRNRTDDVLELGEVALEGQEVGHLRTKNEVRVGLCSGAILSSRFNGYTTMVEVLTLMYAAY